MKKKAIIASKLQIPVGMPTGGFDRMNELGTGGIPFLFIIDFTGDTVLVFTENEVIDNGIFFQLEQFGNGFTPCRHPGSFSFRKSPVSFDFYHKAFHRVQQHLQNGNSYLVNLTCVTPIETSLSAEQIFAFSDAPFRLFVPGKFVVFSPERFVRVMNGVISTCPMKGTIDASLPGAADRILQDPKELAEHYTIVDLLRNDLSMVADRVTVKRFRYLDLIKTNFSPLYQVSSLIEGDLHPDLLQKPGSMMKRLIPAGSVSGAPKQKTLEIIRETELLSRGFYTGVFGYFDGRNLDSSVMIRFIEQTSGGLVYRSGGGITARSQAEAEYREMIEKVYVPVI